MNKTSRSLLLVPLSLLGFSTVTLAQPVVSGNTISWPSSDWYQVQRPSAQNGHNVDWDVCNTSRNGTSCTLPKGNYTVNKQGGSPWGVLQKWKNIMVGEAAVTSIDITTVNVSEIMPQSAVVSWQVSDYATGQVEFGTSENLGSLSELESSFTWDKHIQTLTGLEPGTNYYYRVTSSDANGNRAVSDIATFKTASNDVASNEVCKDFYRDSFQLTTGFDTSPKPNPGSKPTKGVEESESVYGTCLVRMTNHANEPPQGFARAAYSRKQAVNADNTRFIAFANDGYWHIYDADSGDYITVLNGPGGAAELRWDVADPNILYYMDTTGGTKVYQLTLSTNESTVIGDFAGRLPWGNDVRVSTRSEGTHSADGRYWGMQVESNDSEPLGLVVWDKKNDVIVGTWDFAANGVSKRPDHTSMSPSGEYIVASWDGNDLGTTAFSRDFSSQVKLHTKSEHSDLALLPNGNDAYVAVDFQSDKGDIFMLEIQTGERTKLFESYTGGNVSSFHFSGKAFKRPGWILVSSYREGSQWFHEKVFAVELKANPDIRHIAHHQSFKNGYWTEPHATVNQDFTRILFNSNWGINSSNDIDIYQVKLPYSAME